MRRTPTGLVPRDEAGQDVLRKVPIGDTVSVDVTRPRNLRHHQKYWVLCEAIAKALPEGHRFQTAEHVSAYLKAATGHADVLPMKDIACPHCGGITTGNAVYIPGSISFAAMDQTAFNDFYDRCLQIIAKDILPGITADELRGAVEDLVA